MAPHPEFRIACMRHKPTILAKQTVAESRLFRIEAVDLRFANGVESRFERLVGTGHGAVMVAAIDADENLLLIREYAAGVDRYELALPKGRIDGDESPEAAAGRELQEEVGMAARRLIPLTTLSLAPGYSSHETHLILARDLYPSRLPGDEPEPIEVVPWPLADLTALLAAGEVTEARSIAALFLAREALAHG